MRAAEDCWIDGAPADRVPVADRGLQYGDGLFETIACRDGGARFLDLHLARLARGCARLGMPAPAAALLRAEIAQFAAGGGRCIVKLIVTRGSSAVRGYAAPPDAQPRRILQRFGWPDDGGAAERGIEAEFSAVPASVNPLLAGLKHLNRLDNVLARSRLQGSRCAEALMCTPDGTLVGGTMSNLFVVRGNALETPSLEAAGVAGIMRAVVLREAAALGIATSERHLRPADLAHASEIFVTNARIGLWPLRRIGEWQGVAGPVLRGLQARIESLSV
ncbi:MAG: aminodeoxychorismate lyase [Steroidobacteraceae bacterium]